LTRPETAPNSKFMSEDEQLEFLRRQKRQLLHMATMHQGRDAARELLALVPAIQVRIDLLEAQRAQR
jgi:hypothetical protein